MLYLNTIEQLFLLVEQLDQLEVCLPYCRLLAGIPILAVFQNLRWNSNKTSLFLTLWLGKYGCTFVTIFIQVLVDLNRFIRASYNILVLSPRGTS